MEKRLCFLGLGKMGKGITQSLVRKAVLKEPLTLWNRSHETAVDHQRFLGQSASEAVADLSMAISRGDIIWSCLSNEAAVQDVYATALQQDIRGKVFVDSSTIPPAAANLIYAKVREAGGDFIAMPVFGEPTMAEAGMLTCLPSGSAETIDIIRPLLVGVTARDIVDLSGCEAGQASLLKMIGNTFILNTMQMVAEGHVLAEKSGIGHEELHKMIEALFPLGPAKIYSSRMKDGGYLTGKPMVRVKDAQKLAKQVLALAADCDTTLTAYQLAERRLQDAAEQTGGQADISCIYGVVRVENNLDFGVLSRAAP